MGISKEIVKNGLNLFQYFTIVQNKLTKNESKITRINSDKFATFL